MNGSKLAKAIGWIFIGVAIAATLAMILGGAIMWLWNQLMPSIFDLPPLTYWQAVGLLVLSHLLFKGHPHCGPRRPSHPGAPEKRSRAGCTEKEHRFARKVHDLMGDEPPPAEGL